MRYIQLLLIFGLYLTAEVDAQVLLIDQTSGQQGASIVAQEFETAYTQFSSYAAEDLVVPTGELWHIDSLLLYGEYATPSGTPVLGSGIIVSVCQDNGGTPGTVIFTDTILNGADPDQDGTLFYRWDSSLVLNPGSYWLVAAARKDFGSGQTQWQWFSSSVTEDDTALWINPGNGFSLNNCPNWTEVTTCYGSTYEGLSMQLFGCPEAKPSIVGLPEDTSFCINSTLILQATSNATTPTFLWSTGASSGSVSIHQGGTYGLTVTDGASGCMNVDSVMVSSLDTPAVDVGDTFVCPGDLFVASATLCESCLAVWNGASAGDSIALPVGTHWIEVLDTISGCSSMDSFRIEGWVVDPIELSVQSPHFICPGDSVTIFVLNPYDSYLWHDGSTDSFSVFSSASTYSITATDENDCEMSASGEVDEFEQPELLFDYGVASSDSLYLMVQTVFDSYHWSTGANGGSIKVPNADATYELMATDSNGCVWNYDVTVTQLGVKGSVTFQPRLYPNPTGRVTILDRQNNFGIALLSILTVDGRMIQRTSINQRLVELDLSDLPNGLYLVQVQSPTEHTSLKLIKK